MARRSRRKEAEVGADQSNANAAHLTLLGLPAEVRAMILRMVVGDKLIHVFKDVSLGCNARSQCVAEMVGAPEVSFTTIVAGSTPPSASAGDRSINSRIDHFLCPIYLIRENKRQLDLEVFLTNRQLHREAFVLFWRTSQFYFGEGDVLKRCLDRLTESQKTNLRNLALEIRFSCYSPPKDNYDVSTQETRREWPLCDLRNAGSHPLRFLETLDLRLLPYRDMKRNTRASESEAIHAVFLALANLRLLRLKQACVTISIQDHLRLGNLIKGQFLTTEEMAEMAASFQVILLNSTVTKEDQTRFLTSEMQELEEFLNKEQAEYDRNMTEAYMFQKRADENRVKADKMKEQLSKMQAALQDKDEAAIHSLLVEGEFRCELPIMEGSG